MSEVSHFDTQSVRLWNAPQPDTFAVVKFPRPYLAPPRLPCGLRQLDIDRKANIRVKAEIKDIKPTEATYHITSWADTVLYSGIVDSLDLAPANLEISSGEYTRNRIADPNSPASVRINFERSFVTTPKVLVFFKSFDLDRGKNWRLKTTAAEVDTKGFKLNIETWADTILYSATVSWIAYPEDREHIFSASVNTQDIRPWNQPQLKQGRVLTFSNVEFWKTPKVFVAFNEFDIDCKANFRLNAYVDGINQQCLTWHIDAWADTVLYSAGATIIAVN